MDRNGLFGWVFFLYKPTKVKDRTVESNAQVTTKRSDISIVKRIRTHRDSTGVEKTGVNAEVTRTSMAMNLKDVCIA